MRSDTLKHHVGLLIQFLLLTQASLFLFSCENSKNTVPSLPLQVSIASFSQTLPAGTEIIDTLECYRRAPKLFMDTNAIYFGFDSIVRSGPITFLDKPCILYAKFKNDTIYQYDYCLTKYDYLIRPLPKSYISTKRNIASEQNNKDIQTLWDRGTSGKDEFEKVKKSLIAIYGNPQENSDIKCIWNNKGIALRALNNFSTTLVSVYDPKKTYDDRHDWQLSCIADQSNLLSFQLGMNPRELATNIALRDTVYTRSTQHAKRWLVAYVDFWGLPGELSFTISQDDVVESFGWEAKSTGYKSFINNYYKIAGFIDKSLISSHPVIDSSDDQIVKQIRWCIDGKCVYMWYDKTAAILQVGKASIEYLQSLN